MSRLPAGWRIVLVDELKAPVEGSIAIGPFGSRMKADSYVERGVPIIRGTNISESRVLKGEFVYISEEFADELASCNVFPGDLVFPHRGAIGEVAIVPSGPERRFVLSTSLMKLTVDRTNAHPDYLFYFFRSPLGRHELLKNASQVGTPGIATPLTSLRSAQVILPPLDEQIAIAELLRGLDDKIDLNRAMNETLEAIAASIFRAWFVDFEPVKAKAAGATSFAGMSQTLFDRLPDRLTESAMGPIPTGWTASTVGELLEINPSRSLVRGGVAPYLDMASMPMAGHSPAGWVEREVGSGMRFINGDTLLARITPCLENGKTAFVDFLAEGQVGWGSTEYIVLRSKPPLPLVYSYLVAREPGFREFAIQRMSGSSGRQRVPAESLKPYPLVRPPEEALVAFAALVEPLFSLAASNAREGRTLAQQRDLLLPKTISGAVCVK